MLEVTFKFVPLGALLLFMLLNSWLLPANEVLLCLNIELFLFKYGHLISYLCLS
jgi:hypothetical protein